MGWGVVRYEQSHFQRPLVPEKDSTIPSREAPQASYDRPYSKRFSPNSPQPNLFPATGLGLSQKAQQGPVSGQKLPGWEGHEWECLWAPPYNQSRKTAYRPSSGLNNHPHIFLPNPPNCHPPRRWPGSLKSGFQSEGAIEPKVRSAPPKAAPSFQMTNYKQIKSPANLSDGRHGQSAS